MRWMFCLMLIALSVTAADRKPTALIGTCPTELRCENWINSKPKTLAELKGNVVLIRWWTGPQCPHCRKTAPALNEFHEKYAEKGLVVLGVYHHKSSDPLEVKNVEALAQTFGFKFPVAIDPRWQTLKDWWLSKVDSGWTSVTFLLDREGRIRHIHEGGSYAKGEEAYQLLDAAIQKSLNP